MANSDPINPACDCCSPSGCASPQSCELPDVVELHDDGLDAARGIVWAALAAGAAWALLAASCHG